MRVLVVGAGAVGGFFGGRLLQAGRDVTFLVRPRRRKALAETGLVIRSAHGDWQAPAPTVLSEEIGQPFDLILLSCKAYDLDSAMDSFAPAVGGGTAILPLLNGMAHLDRLEARFGADPVLGGLCKIGATLDAEGQIIHLNDPQLLVFGERDGSASSRIQAIEELMRPALFDKHSSDTILQDMWEKWIFLATLAATTCLMRASVGDTVRSGGGDVPLDLLAEVNAVATAQGHPSRPEADGQARRFLDDPSSTMTASMMRDVERGGPVEADHVLGDLLARGAGLDLPLLKLAYAQLKAYEARRRRETK